MRNNRKGFLHNPHAFSDAHAVTESAPPPQAKTSIDTYGAEPPLSGGDPRYLNTGPANVGKSKGIRDPRY